MPFVFSAAVIFLLNKHRNTENERPAGINKKIQEKDITAEATLFDWQMTSVKYSVRAPQQWTLYTKDAARMTK